MAIFWQQIIVIASVCLAVAYLVFHYVRRKRRKADCANCPTLKALQDRRRVKAE